MSVKNIINTPQLSLDQIAGVLDIRDRLLFGMLSHLAGRTAEMGGKDAGEVVDIRIADGGRNLFNGQFRMQQQAAGAVHAGVSDILRWRLAGEAGQ